MIIHAYRYIIQNEWNNNEGNYIGNEGIKTICETMKTNSTLSKLDVDRDERSGIYGRKLSKLI